MKIYDISVPITPEMVTWPGDPPVRLKKISAIEEGESANITQIQLCVHTGTHIDAPKHFFTEGKSLEQLSIKYFLGEVLVMEIGSEFDTITSQVLTSHNDFELLKLSQKVLFKTHNSTLWQSHPQTFQSDYVGLDASGAEILAELDLKLIGLDYLSIATYRDTLRPHQILLSREIILLEGINLSSVTPGSYQLYCAPLLIEGCEGAPARALLIQ
ncbi:MAG: cyclase family protein [Brevefilum sp.]